MVIGSNAGFLVFNDVKKLLLVNSFDALMLLVGQQETRAFSLGKPAQQFSNMH